MSSSTPAYVPPNPSMELSPEEIVLIDKVLEPLRHAKNTLTIATSELWAIDERDYSGRRLGPVSSTDAVLYVLHKYRGEVAAGRIPYDDLLYRVELLAASGPNEKKTVNQSRSLHQLVKNANAERLLIIEARLITEIHQLIQKFTAHLENLPFDFSDFPGLFLTEKQAKQYKKNIFDPIRWDETKVKHSDIEKFATMEGAYTFLRQGHNCPELVGRVDFMRVESVLLTGVTRLNNMSKHDLQKYGFVFRRLERADQFERLLSSSTNTEHSPVDVTTTVVRIRDCTVPPHAVFPWKSFADEAEPDDLVRLHRQTMRTVNDRGGKGPVGPVLVPESHMSLGIRLQWHLFGSGIIRHATLEPWWSQPSAARSSEAEPVRLIDEITLPTFLEVLTKASQAGPGFHFAADVMFKPSLFLYSML